LNHDRTDLGILNCTLPAGWAAGQSRLSDLQVGGGGKIVNIRSVLTIFSASSPAYAASKGGILQLTPSLASAVARDKIRANAVLAE
jgi:2-deoxy-D-gluconate 3-dehydrogenase